jgi:hypothetical protein
MATVINEARLNIKQVGMEDQDSDNVKMVHDSDVEKSSRHEDWKCPTLLE